MHLFTADGCCRAEALLRRLRELSPDSARIRTTFAETLLVQCMLRLGNQEESRARASSLLAEAAEIDPDCAFVYIDRALWCSAAEWRWDQAEDDTRGAVDIAKDVGLRHLAQTSLGLHLIRRGNLEYGTRELPSPDIDYLLPPIVWLGHAGARFLARDFQRSVEVLNQALTLYPNHWFLNLEKGKALAALQDYSGALRSLRRARFLYEGPNPNLDAEIAHVKALSGKRESAISLLSRAQALSLSGVDAARLHSVLGSNDAAIIFLEEACAERDLSLGDVKQDYRFDRLRSDPRFRSALNRVGV
jgi:tetratricopeptide (TPR) repeat protein